LARQMCGGTGSERSILTARLWRVMLVTLIDPLKCAEGGCIVLTG